MIRQYEIDGRGNDANPGAGAIWHDDSRSDGVPAVKFGRDCSTDNSENGTTNELNQVASLNDDGLTYDDKGNLLFDANLTFIYEQN